MQACCVDWMHRSPRFPCRSAPSFSLSRRPRHSHAWVSYPPSPYPFYFLLGRQDLNKGGQQITVKCYDGKVKQKEAVTRLIVLPKMVRPPKSLISTRPCAPLSLSLGQPINKWKPLLLALLSPFVVAGAAGLQIIPLTPTKNSAHFSLFP